MSDPTRVQIEAAVASPTYTVEYNTGAGWVAISDDDIISVSGMVDAGGGSSGLDFGANAAPRGTITLMHTTTLAALAWETLRVRARYGFAGSNELKRLDGVVTGRARALESAELSWSVAGFDQSISDTECFSPLFYRRPAATATTLTSIEDPTNGNYAAGLANYIFWTAGGRPYEQLASYTTAVFYYACEPALMSPEWSWIAGENAWGELDRLARACGGQVFQRADGVMAWVNPIVGTGSGYTFTESLYADIAESGQREDYITLARCAYTGRRLQPQQVVYEDSTPRLIAIGETLVLTLESELPVYQWTVVSGSTLPAETVNAVDLWFGNVAVTVTLTSSAAGRAVISIPNVHATAIIINHLVLWGRPIAVSEEGQSSYGSGVPAREIGEQGGIYVQTRGHAERLCRIYVDIYGTARPARRLTGCGYDPDRTLGEVVGLTCAEWSLSAVAHRISTIDHSDTGASMELTLVPTTGLLTSTDLFEIGGSYSGGTTKSLGY